MLPEQFATQYESVIVFGRVVSVEEPLFALELLRKKYSPDYEEQGKKYAVAALSKVGVYAIQVEHLSGKARKK